jgi:putative ABC transport system substrate-binding protein
MIFRNEKVSKMLRGIKIKSKWKIFFHILLIAPFILLNGCGKNAPEKKVYRVGILSGLEAFIGIADGFKAKMAELGYVEGENITYDLRELNADPVREKRVAEEFVRDKVDMIFAFPTDSVLAAKVATRGTEIPVVFGIAGLEGNDLVESVPIPGDNITGVRFSGPDNTVKRLDILSELMPQAKRILITYDPNYPNASSTLGLLRPAAESMGLTLVEDPVENLEELEATLKKRSVSDDIGIDGILIMPEVLTQTHDGFSAILNFAAEHKVPIGGGLDYTVEQGAIFSFTPDNVEMGMLAATLADKIFKGTQAGTIMVQTTRDHLKINYKVIQELGLDVSEGLLSMADEIIR